MADRSLTPMVFLKADERFVRSCAHVLPPVAETVAPKADEEVSKTAPHTDGEVNKTAPKAKPSKKLRQKQKRAAPLTKPSVSTPIPSTDVPTPGLPDAEESEDSEAAKKGGAPFLQDGAGYAQGE